MLRMWTKVGVMTGVFLASVGCVSMEQALVLRENGSGTWSFLVSVDKKLIDLAAAMGEGGDKKDPFADLAPMEGPTKAERKAMKAAGLAFERFEAGEIDGGYGVDLAVSFQRPASLSAISENAPDGPTLQLRPTETAGTYDLVFSTIDLAGTATGAAAGVGEATEKLDAELQANLAAIEGGIGGSSAEAPASAPADANPFANADVSAMLTAMGIAAPTIGMTIEVPGDVVSLTPNDPGATIDGHRVRIATAIPLDGAASAGQAFDDGKPAMKVWTVRFAMPAGHTLPEELLTR